MAETVLADFHLPRRLRPVLAALARIVCTDEIERQGLTDAVIDGLELHLRTMPALFRTGLMAGLASFEAGAVAWPSRPGRRFSKMAAADQAAYFASWWASPLFPIRQFAKGIKGLLAMTYWEEPSVKAHLAYHPERWIAEVAARRLASYAADIREHDRVVVAPDPLLPPSQLTRKRHAAA
jgi:hypothetical protein